MTDIKRNFSDIASPANLDDTKKLHVDSTATTKVGRKPIDTEPKSKRTAQNRAAQRAYRERKERKMKELEDKVRLLEDANVRALTETDFLRAQVDVLKNELAKYTGGSDFLDLNLPTKVGHLSHPNNHHSNVSTGTPHGSMSSSNSVASLDNDKPSSASSVSNNSPGFAFDNPWSKDNIQKLKHQHQQQQQQKVPQGVPDLVLGSSSSSTPLNDNLLVTPESLTGLSTSSKYTGQNNVPTNLDFTNQFDEQVDPFCVKLNEACGTKSNPVPKFKRSGSKANTSVTNNSPLAHLVSPESQQYTNSSNIDFMNDSFFNGVGTDYNFNFDSKNGSIQDPLSFLQDDNFDLALAFGDPSPTGNEAEADPISLLTTEESIYDPLTNNSDKLCSTVKADDVNTDFNFNDFVKNSLPEKQEKGKYEPPSTSKTTNNNEEEDKDEVVPAPPQTLKCSEIWDRITSHPKYTELDIDGLCNELKSKAKCSEKGVVINTADVNQLLERSIKH